MQRTMFVVCASVLLMSGCATSDTQERQAKLERIRTEAIARREQAEREAEQARKDEEERQRLETVARRDAWLALPETKEYIKQLCAMAPGPLRDETYTEAWTKHGIIVSTDTERAELARSSGMARVFECGEPATSVSEEAAGFTWSNTARRVV